ncbi:MAG: hypothetical protein R2882_14810, partial [Gemmatimonadales bacterium]
MAAGRRNDLAVFRRDFLAVDQSYTAEHRAEAERRLTRLDAEVAELSAAAFELELARIVALADNGHTNSPGARRSRRYSRVPLRLAPFGTDFFVLRADSANADLLGARLTAIDHHPVADLRRAGHALWGGTAAWRDRQVPFLLESPEQLQAIGLAARGDRADYEFVLPNGRTVQRLIAADPANPRREGYFPSRWLSPEPLDTDRGDWRMLAPPGLPWAFHEPTVLLRHRVDRDLGAVVAQLRINRDAPDRPMAEFLAAVAAAVTESGLPHFVLDLRFDGGGDLNTTRDFVQRLPRLVPGRIFVLTSPYTFSAAISTTGYLEQAGGGRVTIVGEPVGDRLEFWAEGGLVVLPYSGAAMSVARERHDYRNGCRGYRDCHGPVRRNPIAVASLAPDVAAPLTID